MVDMSKTIAAKSDQLNADDLIGRSLTIRVSGVSLLAGEQPVGINYEGDEGKPYKPCKSMRRVLVGVWGTDGNVYVGRSMTLFRDEKVIFGGAEVGGVRISHMSNIDKPITMSLTATKKTKKPFTVQPLTTATEAAPASPAARTPEQIKATAAEKAAAIIAAINAASDADGVDAALAKDAKPLDRLRNAYSELSTQIETAAQDKKRSFGTPAASDADFEDII